MPVYSSNFGPHSDPRDVDGPPTLAVPVSPPPPVPAPYLTPPPVADLYLGCSSWGDGDHDAPVTGRRPPKVGDSLVGFRLVGELGRGAFARVFLAHQEALAARPVALKVSLRPTREAQRLARLQHTNVVPVYSVHDEGTVQVICMPFLGKTTLADLVRAFQSEHPSRASGRRSTSARAARTTSYDSKSKASKFADSKGGAGPARAPVWSWSAAESPPLVGDPRAVLQVVAQLAAGLAHAHARGILHLDLKPANVLLADTGEPMLLDFNLSLDTADPDRDRIGGTMPYMAIEQLREMRDRVGRTVDGRTDLFALGAMAYELLTGSVPFPTGAKDVRDIEAQVALRQAGPPPLRDKCPDATPAVEAIVRKLLAPDPADRYQCADDLSEDVQRHLADRPLKHARETSARERFAKWRRRNPRLAGRALLAGAVLLAGGFGVLAQHRHATNAALVAVDRARAARAELDVTRLDLILPDDPAARARGTKVATERLAAYGLPGDAKWQTRADVRRLPDADRAALAADLGELMALLARAKWQDAEQRPGERGALAAEAWELASA
ncbi:MAG: serine/threonine protein kinase, partial [Planctomycetes bacterium]|nr:serine/threonine protein kinase [Planctomycetota bacterium]